jgi:hypothetical protein
MAQFTHSLCEEVIRTEGRCSLSKNEIMQMARLALRTLHNENIYLRDAVRYRWLRDAKPNQLHLTRNEHACNYWSAAEEIDTSPKTFQDEPEAAIQAMKDADVIWRLQIYPHTPVGFYWMHRATLDDLIDAAMTAEDSPSAAQGTRPETQSQETK